MLKSHDIIHIFMTKFFIGLSTHMCAWKRFTDKIRRHLPECDLRKKLLIVNEEQVQFFVIGSQCDQIWRNTAILQNVISLEIF